MADTKISNLNALAAAPSSGDFFALVDTSASETKKIDAKYLARASDGQGPNVTGGGTLALGGFTLTVPATGTAALTSTAALLATANVFTIGQTIDNSAGTGVGLKVQGLAGQDIFQALTAAGDVTTKVNREGNINLRNGRISDAFNLGALLTGVSKVVQVVGMQAFTAYAIVVHLSASSSTGFNGVYRRWDFAIRTGASAAITGYTPSTTPTETVNVGTLAGLTFTLSSPADGTVDITIGNSGGDTIQYVGLAVDVLWGYTITNNPPRITFT